MPNVDDEYTAEWTQINGTPLIANALGAQEQDIGVLAFSSMANAIEQESIPEGFTVIGGCCWGGWTNDPPRFSNQYASMQGSEYEEIADLEGGTLAINGRGTAVDIIARIALEDAGLDPEEDVDIQEVDFGAIPSALREGRVDCGVLLQPFYYEMEQENEIQTVFQSEDGVENYQYLVYVARDEFLDNHGELVEMWLEDYWEALQWWSDSDNRDDMLDIAAEVMDLSRDEADDIIQTEQDYYHGEDGLAPEVTGLEVPLEEMVNLGFLNSMPDIESYIDTTYLPDEAQ